MPIYEYKCQNCNKDFEIIVSINDDKNPQCPFCQSNETKKNLSIFSSNINKISASSCGNSKFTWGT